MDFDDRLSRATPAVQALFLLLLNEVVERLGPIEHYPTDTPDYRFAQPDPGHVVCEIVPMLRPGALRLRIRVDEADLPPCTLDLRDVAVAKPGTRWVQVRLTRGSELAAAIALIETALRSD